MRYQYYTAVILLIATLTNFTYSMLIGPELSVDIRDAAWYNVTHKLQLSIVCLSVMYYQRNPINFWAGWGYFSIILLNWLFYALDWGGYKLVYIIAMTTGFAYMGYLFVVLGLDTYQRWKTP